MSVREGRQVGILRCVFAERYSVKEARRVEPVKVHEPGVVQNPPTRRRNGAPRATGKLRRMGGYKVQVAESIARSRRVKAKRNAIS